METMEVIDLIKEFRNDLQMKGVAASTKKNYPRYVKNFHAFINGGNLLEVNEEVLSSYLAHLQEQNLERTTLNSYFTGLSSFFEFLMWKKYVTHNPVLPVRKHYLRTYKNHDVSQRRQCLSIEQAKMLVESIMHPKEQAVVLLLLKTGLRRKELSELDLNNLDMENMTIHLKPTGKRSNEIVYFDKETAYILNIWLQRRKMQNKNNNPALFLDRYGNRLSPHAIEMLFVKHATACGLHNPKSERLEDRLTPHCARHWFSSQLLEAVMPRHFIKELRGDANHDILDVYTHINREKLKQAYLACIPQLGVV
jgi:integrase/recombinase XerD